jgi:beta-glucosidase/6-phospho-beta-glucosidase/beta-galactosidase
MKCRDKPKPLAFSGHLYSKVKDECKHWMHFGEILNLTHKYFITSLCLPGHYHDQSKMGVALVTELLAGIRVQSLVLKDNSKSCSFDQCGAINSMKQSLLES